jgi:two-component system response regulator MprA
VLVVEDNPDTRDAIVLLLELRGYEAQGAGDGEEALRVARSGRERLCLILLDINMPRMNGIAFRLAQLADEALRSIPVVVLTALPLHHPMLGPLADVEALQKPVDADHLAAIVERYCHRERRDRVAPGQ